MQLKDIRFTLILTLLFIIISPFIKITNKYYIISLLILLAILHVLAHLRKNRLDRLITGSLFIIFLASYLIFNNVEQKVLALRTASITAFLLLNLVLLIGPWTRFKPSLIKYYKDKRHLGVTVLLLALVHFSLVFRDYFNYSIYQEFQASFTFFGSTALFILILLGITSWDYLQKHFNLRLWKLIHFLSLLSYLGMTYIFYTIYGSLTTFEIIIIILFILYWIIVAPYSLAKKIIHEANGWKQLHVLIYVAYAALILHIWNGPLKLQGLWLKILFILIISFTILSHLIGWIIKYKEDAKIKKEMAKLGKDNHGFIPVEKVENFEENKGKRFIVNNNEVAVFKYQSKFIAVSNVCRHQKGPIYQGKIMQGCIYCPWHNWSYSIKDGSASPPHKDRLPYYETKVVDNIVYVSKNPL